MSPDQHSPAVSILVVAYNSRDFISACLSSIADACLGIAYEVLLIDNGAGDTAEFVRKRFPSVKIVQSQGNVGYGTGNNILATSAHPNSEYLVVLNPDTELLPGAIQELVLAANENHEFGALGGTPRADDDEDGALPMVVLPSLIGVLYGMMGLAHINAGKNLPTGPIEDIWETEVLSGFFVLIRRDVWEEIGGFDESFFLYAEDADISRRISQTGAKLGLVTKSRVKHDTGSGAQFSATRQRFKMLGTAHYANKHFAPIKRTGYKFALWLQCLIKFLGSSILKGRGERMVAMADAYRMPALKPWRWFWGYNRPGADPRRVGGS